MKEVKIGILGAGYVANTFHMPAFQEIEGVKVVAIYSHRKEIADSFSRTWKIPKIFHGEEGISKLSADPEVELVDIALPTNLHLTATRAAAENHKNVICEKPLARNQYEAREMLDVVRKYGVQHFYAENQVFMPQVKRAEALIERQSFGDIFWLRCRQAHLSQHSGWFWDPKSAGGGVMLDLGSHSIEIAQRLLRKTPVSVFGWASKFTRTMQTDDNSLILVKYDGAQLLQAENTWITRGGLDIHIEVHGADGSLYLTNTREAGISMFYVDDSTKQTGTYETIGEATQTKKARLFPKMDEHQTLGFVDEFRHFLLSITIGERAIETYEEGYKVNQLIDAAYESSNTGKWIQLP